MWKEKETLCWAKGPEDFSKYLFATPPITIKEDQRVRIVLEEGKDQDRRKPHYSVAELEKIFNAWCYADNRGSVGEFIDFLKDKTRVKEILKKG